MTTPLTDNVMLLKISKTRADSLMETDETIRQIKPEPEIYKSLTECASSIQIFEKLCREFADRPALGFRAHTVAKNPATSKNEHRFLPKFETLSYGEVWNRVVSLASAFHAEGFDLRPEDRVGIMAFSSPEAAIADFAALYLGATSVPLQKEMAVADLKRVIDETEFRIFVCTVETLKVLREILPSTPSIKNLVVIDYTSADDDQCEELTQTQKYLGNLDYKIRLHTFSELVAAGGNIARAKMEIPNPKTNPLMTLTYTSGSTGFPKGAMFPESLWCQVWKSALSSPALFFPTSILCFFPLNHIAGRLTIMQTLTRGGTVYFPALSDMSTLFEDFRLVRPTVTSLVPRIAEMIYQHYRQELARRPGESENIMAEMRYTFMGDRLIYGVIGTAPTAPEVKNFLKVCFSIPVVEGFGATETMSITFEERIVRESVIDYRLVDVPEAGYRTTDQPYPRGELRLKAKRTIPGYFKNPEATQALFDEDGYLKTGDIVEERGVDHIVWIDRKNNVLKLSQGEFVTLWRLESLFNSGSRFIKQVYLYGNSSRSYLLGVIVPNDAAIAEQNGETSPLAKKQFVRSEMARIARDAKLRPYECPRDFILETNEFTNENGLLTGTNKPARAALKKKYGALLEQLYTDIEEKHYEQFAALSADAGKNLSVVSLVKKVLEVTLGVDDIDLNQNFAELGGDSLHAATFVEILQTQYHKKVQVGTLLNPAGNLQDVVREAESSGTRIEFETIHGENAPAICTKDLKLRNFFSPEEFQEFSGLIGTETKKNPRGFLLTGAAGFLGRFLGLELLEKTAASKVYCVIRAKSDADARQRLTDGFSSDPELAAQFEKLAENRLVVWAGDLVKAQFGLSAEKYELLTREVDSIFHAGALVNHSLTYRQLFEPNVMGTAEVIRLALKHRLKSLNFISSVAVSGLKPRLGEPTGKEEDDIRNWAPEFPCTGGGYAQGYALSKWASELLALDFQETFSVPVNVFRCSMILPHRKFAGQFNASDLLTRLLCSLINTGLAPESFYLKSDPEQFFPHYDGNPVDFVAAAIVAVGLETSDAFRTYQVSNPYRKDRISLDSVVNWIQSAGYKLSRIPNYDSWFQSFKEGLRRLDDTKQAASSLPIIQSWTHPLKADEWFRVDTCPFEKKVHDLKPENETEIPRLNEKYIHKYLEDLRVAGLLT